MPIRGRGKSRGGSSKTRLNGTIPCTPKNITVQDVGTGRAFNNGAIQVTFTVDSECTPATSFTATASTGQSVTGSSSPLLITGIATGATPTVTVKATNQYGDSLSSSATAAVTITTVPATPSAPSASSPTPSSAPNVAGSTTDSVSWAAPANGGKAITSYDWLSSDSKSGNTSSTSVSVNQEGGTSQSYQVRACNANGCGSYSASSSPATTTFTFTPYSFTPYSFTPYSFTPIYSFTPYSFTPYSFTPVYSFTPMYTFTPYSFTPYSFTPMYSFTPVYSFVPYSFTPYAFTPMAYSFTPLYTFTPTYAFTPMTYAFTPYAFTPMTYAFTPYSFTPMAAAGCNPACYAPYFCYNGSCIY